MKRFAFLRESLKNLKEVGTVTRSSKFTCKAMIKPIDFSKAKYIVELGAGDGVVTKHILEAMAPDAALLSFEVNPNFCDKIRELKDDRLIVIEDSAEELPKYLKKHKIKQIDGVISAIPFVSLPKEFAYTIVELCKKYMKPKSIFTQIHYSLLTKKIYKDVFGNVEVDFEPRNIPPAFILICQKRD